MWIKICGITSLEDAELAIAAGADALGFVFAESPRRVTPAAARKIVEKLPSSVEKIGVFVDALLDEMVEAYMFAGLTGVQLHGSGHAFSSRDLRTRIGESSAALRLLRVVRYDGGLRRIALALDGQEDAVLVDTCVAGKFGGTGIAFDWIEARESFLHAAPHLRLIAAGGLRPENVREAILTLRPWGVDVSSGVEARPGKKDPSRVADFIRAARAAEAELGKAARA